jgi:hypothetical protein
MEPVCCPATSVNNYQSLQRDIPEERRFRSLSRADQQNKLAQSLLLAMHPAFSFMPSRLKQANVYLIEVKNIRLLLSFK